MKKQISLAISLIVAICMIAAVVAGTAIFSSAATSADGLYEYTLSNNRATITKCKDASITEFALTQIDGYDIVGIGNNAFQSCENLVTVTLPETVTTIGTSAFNDCIRLASIIIPEGVTTIGYSAFRSCTSLATVSLPKSLVNLGVDYYESGAFRDCTNLTTVTIAPGGTNSAKIAAYAFYNCPKLESISIPGNYTSIGSSAFENCKALQSMEWETSIDDLVTQTIGDRAFYGCENLIGITLPGPLSTIGISAFSDCIRLAEAAIPEGVTTINHSAFRGCTSLATVSLPKSLVNLGTVYYENGAFRDCTNLKTVTIASGGTNSAKIANYAFYNCPKLESISIPGNYTSIGESAFYNCKALQSMEWETSSDDLVTQTIGDRAFYGCENLKNISLPGHLSTIGNNAFNGCIRLASLTVPEGVTTIYYNAFNGCASLATVSLPKSLVNLGTDYYESGAFRDCTNLKTVTIASGGTNSAKIANYAFCNCPKLESISIPGNYTSIGESAFYNCKALQSMEWETSSDDLVTQTIGEKAFYGCANLKTLSLSGHLSEIGKNAFSGCSALEYADYYNTEDKWNEVSRNNSALPAPVRIESNDGFIRLIFKEDAPVYYTLTYMVDGAVYGGTEQLKEGDPITPREAPAKEGYTFSGWSEIPATMPAYDITIEGRFTENKPVPVTLENDEYDVSVSFYEGDFVARSDELSVVVEDISASENKLGSYKLELKYPELSSVALYEIHMINSHGEFVQPKADKNVTVKMRRPQSIDLGKDFYIYHKRQNGTTEYLKIKNNTLRVEGNYIVFTIASFSEFLFVQEAEAPVITEPAIAIKGFMNSRSVAYKTTINFSAKVTDAPSGAAVHWFVNGTDSGTGGTFTVSKATASYTVQAKLIGSGGKVLAESETESVSVNTGLFARIIAFFRNLFGSLPVITQG